MEPRGRGRPKLGVVAREVTLLPRHWEWLGAQPGGASVALRKLVDEARRASGDTDRARAARDAAYHFMSAMAGNLAGFEEASRALFADDRRRFVGLIAGWPDDIRDHIVKLAFSDRAEPSARSRLHRTPHPLTRRASVRGNDPSRLSTGTPPCRNPLSLEDFLVFLAPLMLSNALQSLFGTVNASISAR